MITLITGYNNTGKTTWIANTISKEYNVCCLFNLRNPIKYVEVGSVELPSFSESYVRLDDNNVLDIRDRNILHSITCRKCIFFNYPENGLHPSLHSKVVEEVIKLHNQGYDIHIETHSDHIIHAIRVAVKQGLIKLEDVKFLFFKTIDEIVEVKLNQRGRIVEDCPDGFCDQYEINLDKLL